MWVFGAAGRRGWCVEKKQTGVCILLGIVHQHEVLYGSETPRQVFSLFEPAIAATSLPFLLPPFPP